MTPHRDAAPRLRAVRVGFLLLVTALAFGACGTTPVPPPAGAAPDVVARAYLDALVAGDCSATRALLAGDANPAMSDLCGIGHVDAYRGLTGPAGTGADRTYGVTLTLRDMPRMSGWPDGEAGVFIQLLQRDGGPWRISGVTSGP